MTKCPSCREPIPRDHRFCGRCGAPADGPVQGDDETATSVATRGSRADSGSPGDRFPPGTRIAERYRIVGLLGRGGMGEVYRADDLVLGRPVALKFLPRPVESDPRRRQQFLNEVRTALRISHPNVCRVHDIGEVSGAAPGAVRGQGRHYISMEFVDGDDLASLLRRIGRLPPDKAIETSRQLCAGIAAAHAEGILHRDLKPSNVMIDGRGQVKITDFGLAGAAGAFQGDEIHAGTPLYMAPEQRTGKEVTVRSDLYALGLVLYEIFTGRRAFEGTTPAEIARSQETAPASPSSHVGDLDPAVERVILRCLDPDPANRPGSALAVAAALPGGDPLAAALKAGETPAPELVAEAGASGGLRPAVAVAVLGGVLAMTAALVELSERSVLTARAAPEKPPAVLEDRAREILRAAGYAEDPADSLYFFEPNWGYYRHLESLEQQSGRWSEIERGQPPALTFVYRQSPELLIRQNAGAIGDWLDDPDPTLPGMTHVRLDTDGRLMLLHAVPPERHDAGSGGEDPDWRVLLEAAGLDPPSLTPAAPAWLPPVWADSRVAWEGVYPEAPEIRIRIEAASYLGRAVFFRVVEPWTVPREASPRPRTLWERLRDITTTVLFVVAVLWAGLVAFRNVRLGRGDRVTAIRFALLIGAIRFLWILAAHHVAANAELATFTGHLAWSLHRVGLVYVFYLALEPYARRLWPHMLVSWVRLFRNRFRDPLVGRDVLVGALFGTFLAFDIRMMERVAESLPVQGYALEAGLWSFQSLGAFRHAVAAIAAVQTTAILQHLVGLMALLILRLVLRRTWLMVVAYTAMVMLLYNPGHGNPIPYLVSVAIGMVAYFVVFFRFGLLALLVGVVLNDLLLFLPLTYDLSAWWATCTWLVLAIVLATAAWGFWVALAGRPLFRDEILQRP